MRVVLDTNVVVAAMRSHRGASAELIRLAVRKQITLIGGLTLALEYIDVCSRPTTRERTNVAALDATRFAEEVIGLFEPVEIRFRWRPAGPDAGDDHVIETALNGRADAVVTFNLRDFAEASRRFGLPVLPPGGILRILESTHE